MLGATGPANLRRNVEGRVVAAVAFSERLRTVLAAFIASSLSQRQIVLPLNELAIPAPRGGTWSLVQVQRVIQRLRPSTPP
jgi:hypothetical protein